MKAFRWPLSALLPFGLLMACSGASEPAVEEPAQPPELAPIDIPIASASDEALPNRTEAQRLLTEQTDPRQSGRYAPRDECGALPGASAFRESLASAVVDRNVDAIVQLAHPEIKLDFGGGEGREELRRRLNDPNWTLWDELEAILPLGCAVNSRDGLTMPWHFAQEYGDRDGYALMIVMGEEVPLLAEADKDATVISRISWDAVELLSDYSEDRPFARVEDAQGREGYVDWKKLRSLIDHRLIAGKQDQAWQITAIVAGD